MGQKHFRILEAIEKFVDWFNAIHWESKAIFILSILFTISNSYLNDLSNRSIEVTNNVVDNQISEVESAAENLSDNTTHGLMDTIKTEFAEMGKIAKKSFAIVILVLFAYISYLVGKCFDIPKKIIEWLAEIDDDNKIIKLFTKLQDDGKFLYAFLLYDVSSLVFNIYTIYGLVTI